MQIETFEAPHLGMNTEVQLGQVPKGQALMSANLLPGYPGRCPVRGPLTVSDALPTAGKARTIWTHPTLGSLIAMDSPLTKVYSTAAVGTGLTDVSPADTTTVPGGQHAAVGNHVYGIGYGDGPADASASNAYVVDWNGTTLTKHVHAPRGGRGLAFWLNRLFVLGGNDPDLNEPRDFFLLWSDPFDGVDSPLTDAATTWKDDVSGLVNKISIAGISQPTGLAVMGRNLAIFSRDGIHVMRGSGPSDWQVRQEIYGVGCVDARSIVSVEDGVYFASDDGYYYYDGVTLACVSTTIRSKFTSDIVQITATRLDHQHLALSLTVDNHGVLLPRWSAILRYDTGAWTELSSMAMSPGPYLTFVASSTIDGAICVDGQRVWSLRDITRVSNGGTPTDPVGTHDTYDSLAYGIPARVKTRIAMLAEPDRRSIIRSIRVDAVLQGNAEESTNWHVSLIDASGTNDGVHDYPTLIPVAEVSPTIPPVPTRAMKDLYVETDQAGLDITLDGPAGDPPTIDRRAAEIHSSYIFFDVTRPAGPY